jgi:hypothetical protein
LGEPFFECICECNQRSGDSETGAVGQSLAKVSKSVNGNIVHAVSIKNPEIDLTILHDSTPALGFVLGRHGLGSRRARRRMMAQPSGGKTCD